MTGERKKREAQLRDDAFEDQYDQKTFPNENEAKLSPISQWSEDGITDEEVIDEKFLFEEEFMEEEEENVANVRTNALNKAEATKRKKAIVALGLGSIAVVSIVVMLWKMTVSSNGFQAAQMAPVPAEPIDVAERERSQTSQPTDYADDEQMRTMNYDDVNSIYGLALKQQEENRKKTKATDSVRQDASVQQELTRSQQLARQPRSRNYSNDKTPSPRRSQDEYTTTEDPLRNKARDEYLMRAGFNTVKAEAGNGGTTASSNHQEAFDRSVVERSQIEANDPIPGVVSGDQTISNGSRVMFRTLADAMIRGRFAPKGSILVGFVQVNNTRALFNITTLRLLATGEAVPVRLRALDLDMNEGLAVQSEKPSRQQIDQATNNALNQAAGQAAWSAGYSVNRATQIYGAGNALATLGAGLASAATTGRRREVRQKLQLQDGFKVFFVPIK
ncbi:conjugative transposon protein TraM [Telluribacter humicola]|uniref:conjugative transposon protein TraM n=1 Tax=Telluribacter humicola TaxID=1720261 RepID=UPI001A97BF13|nr:conjugative transposon protein TraM [Telluribacter humicola]